MRNCCTTRSVSSRSPRSSLPGLKIRARDSNAALSVVAAEAVIRPKQRLAQINADMERDLARRKERDHGYKDVVESAYQRPSLPYSRRYWKSVSLSSRATPSQSRDDEVDEDAKLEHVRYLRYRLTRLGGVMLDRRDAFMQRMGISNDDGTLLRRRRAFGWPLNTLFGDVEDEEMRCRLQERWRFDQEWLCYIHDNMGYCLALGAVISECVGRCDQVLHAADTTRDSHPLRAHVSNPIRPAYGDNWYNAVFQARQLGGACATELHKDI
ncbi:hypothetical protein EDD17DRAFT_967391 [Pisolithus thermaeus]|nr:hypothetical protein EDD17DRAFT_967391 [Pisolithus thermaeus]